MLFISVHDQSLSYMTPLQQSLLLADITKCILSTYYTKVNYSLLICNIIPQQA